MPRRARLAIANVAWHIIQRGNNRSACFYSENDYLVYLHLLGQLSLKYGCAIHAYCLMTNHVHLLLTPDTASGPSLLMKHLGQNYVQYINRTYERTGTLWEGRFKSCLAQDENYALHCYRYIELNPVRAGMVRKPGDYRWSSFGHNVGRTKNELITAHPSYRGLGSNSAQREKAYMNRVEAGLSEDLLKAIRLSTRGNFVLGSDEFGREIESALNRQALPRRPGRPGKSGK